ncbi:MAG: cadherin-like beta sandwich domain-containing protein [Clostridia bacterium]|nr:cadherin-like beta sandwich domain-containing protein [Clostridia bacterium]
MKALKRIISLVVAVALVLSLLTFSASAAGSSLAFSANQLKIGDTLTVTARFSTTSSDKMYGLEGYITYNPKIIEYVSGDNCNLLTDGKVKIVLTSAGKTNLEQSLTFKAVAAGSSVIALENLVYVNVDDQQKTLEGSSAPITVINQSSEASANANLKGLAVSSGTLTPKFNPDVTEYTVTIANDVTELWVSAAKADEKATFTVEGSKDMKVGLNKRVIVVTAENGTVKKYTVTITRLDANGQIPETEQTEEPLNNLSEVIVDEQEMYIVEDFADTELPKGFNVIEYAFNGKTIPALSDDNYVLLMLRLPDNSASGFYVYDKNGVFTKLIAVNVGGQDFYILPTEEAPHGYSAVNDFKIGEITVPAFKSDKVGLGDFAIVYAKGPSGKTGYYCYDTVEQTMQRLSTLAIEDAEEDTESVPEEPENTDLVSSFIELNANGKIVVITIIAVIVLLIAAIVILIIKIVNSGKEELDEDEDDAIYDNNDIVGFEYVSVDENKEQPTEENEE